MNLNSCEGGLISQGTLPTIIPGYMGGIAVGQLNSGIRYLYYCGGIDGQPVGFRASIYKAIISSGGISTPIKIYEAPNSNFDFETSELDLSPNGTMLALATNGETFGGTSPSTPRYYIAGLNASGDWDGAPVKTFDIAVNPDVNYGSRGVEFY